jgi:hypothetical protein
MNIRTLITVIRQNTTLNNNDVATVLHKLYFDTYNTYTTKIKETFFNNYPRSPLLHFQG